MILNKKRISLLFNSIIYSTLNPQNLVLVVAKNCCAKYQMNIK